MLNVIDFQPLHPTPEYSTKYIDHLSLVRNKYPDLHGVLSGKIYDDTSFFSKQMLFGRFTDDSKINSVTSPAFDDYLSEYIKLIKNAKSNHNQEAKDIVFQRHKAYDIYSSIKDPAVGLFDAYFGKEWSHDFVHNYLFPLSKSSATENIPIIEPVHHFSLNKQGDVNHVVSNNHKQASH